MHKANILYAVLALRSHFVTLNDHAHPEQVETCIFQETYRYFF